LEEEEKEDKLVCDERHQEEALTPEAAAAGRRWRQRKWD